MIAIVDYDAGNVRSVELALERLDAPCVVTADPAVIEAADAVILPGVGAFGDAMASLRTRALTGVLGHVAAGGRPFLGICLGMQALFDTSEESPGVPGLGIIPGEVRRLRAGERKVPHMGWNSLAMQGAGSVLSGCGTSPYVYFVHSYACHAANPEDVLATAEYGEVFHAAVRRGNVLGMQFHPEKSGSAGSRMLANFIAMVNK